MVEPLELDFDWDWLIILDACRYDYFKRLWRRSRVEPRLSWGSCTLEFLEHLPDMRDAMVVTSHPFVHENRHKFAAVVDCGFDYRLGTCPPWRVVLKVLRSLPLLRAFKRRIIWFLQPHHPFIAHPRLHIPIFDDPECRSLTPFERVERMFREAKARGILSRAYEANLKLVLREVEKLLPHLRGRVAITSDHGEGLGEPLRPEDPPVFSHPCNRDSWELRLVPFTVLDIA